MSDVKDTGWTVIGEGTKPGYVLCRCSCEAQTESQIARIRLQSGRAQSCSRCSARPLTAKTHGAYGSPTYIVWKSMLGRCRNPNNPDYSNYGGRGIKVCERWCASFENFLADMGVRPSMRHSVDRVDNDGNYESGNCRWATTLQQARHKRNNTVITFRGRAQCMSAWAQEVGLKTCTLWRRLVKYGWSVEKALTTPPQHGDVASYQPPS
jgi:hypothetical protein